nr:ORF1 [Torque teno felis virus]
MARFRRWRRRWRRRKRPTWFRKSKWNYSKRWFRKRRKRRGQRRVSKRTRQTVILWNPESRVRCTITGFVLGLTTDNAHTISRLHNTWWTNDVANKFLVGGGVSLNLFSLQFLWTEHRHYHNFWFQSNDGYDLARYYGTKWYLPPLRDVDYIFWWDTDLNTYSAQDYMRGHPVNLLATKNAKFIRNCKYNRNTRTTKVMIRPPANITSQWKYQTDWLNFPLFLWGVTLIDWRTWFSKTQGNQLPMVTFTANESPGPGQNNKPATQQVYCPYIDTGTGNRVSVIWASSFIGNGPNVSGSTWYAVDWATDLPYWLVFYGQNRNMDMNAIPRSVETSTPANVCWFSITWPKYQTAAQIEGGMLGGKYITWIMQASEAQKIARSGPFVPAFYQEIVQLPLMYKSLWSWGGTLYQDQPVIRIPNAKQQVSVKNPATLQNYVIRPWDTFGGLLTASALRCIVAPSIVPDERPTLLLEKPPTGDAVSEEYDETASEAEEIEEDSDREEDVRSIVRTLKRRLLREQFKRRQLHKFFKCMVNEPRERYSLQE